MEFRRTKDGESAEDSGANLFLVLRARRLAIRYRRGGHTHFRAADPQGLVPRPAASWHARRSGTSAVGAGLGRRPPPAISRGRARTGSAGTNAGIAKRSAQRAPARSP